MRLPARAPAPTCVWLYLLPSSSKNNKVPDLRADIRVPGSPCTGSSTNWRRLQIWRRRGGRREAKAAKGRAEPEASGEPGSAAGPPATSKVVEVEVEVECPICRDHPKCSQRQ